MNEDIMTWLALKCVGKVLVFLIVFHLHKSIKFTRFDVMNSRRKFAPKLNKLSAALGLHWQEQEGALLAMLRVMENMVNYIHYIL